MTRTDIELNASVFADGALTAEGRAARADLDPKLLRTCSVR
jgi:hypothetical protein